MILAFLVKKTDEWNICNEYTVIECATLEEAVKKCGDMGLETIYRRDDAKVHVDKDGVEKDRGKNKFFCNFLLECVRQVMQYANLYLTVSCHAPDYGSTYGNAIIEIANGTLLHDLFLRELKDRVSNKTLEKYTLLDETLEKIK